VHKTLWQNTTQPTFPSYSGSRREVVEIVEWELGHEIGGFVGRLIYGAWVSWFSPIELGLRGDTKIRPDRWYFPESHHPPRSRSETRRLGNLASRTRLTLGRRYLQTTNSRNEDARPPRPASRRHTQRAIAGTTSTSIMKLMLLGGSSERRLWARKSVSWHYEWRLLQVLADERFLTLSRARRSRKTLRAQRPTKTSANNKAISTHVIASFSNPAHLILTATQHLPAQELLDPMFAPE